MRAEWTALLLLFLCTAAYSQGILPPTPSSTTASGQSTPLLIGDDVPIVTSVQSAEAHPRRLSSYRGTIEILVVVVLDPDCKVNAGVWKSLRALDEKYRDWRVAFLTISTGAQDRLATQLSAERLKWPVSSDPESGTLRLLGVSATPMVLIIDEGSALRYRGPADKVDPALSTLIGHTEAVKDPEPPMQNVCSR